MKYPMKRAAFSAFFALSIFTFSGCDSLLGGEEEAPEVEVKEPKAEVKKEEPKKVEIPAYVPTGDDAALKTEGAKDITAENALEKAKALEIALDAELAAAANKKAH